MDNLRENLSDINVLRDMYLIHQKIFSVYLLENFVL